MSHVSSFYYPNSKCMCISPSVTVFPPGWAVPHTHPTPSAPYWLFSADAPVWKHNTQPLNTSEKIQFISAKTQKCFFLLMHQLTPSSDGAGTPIHGCHWEKPWLIIPVILNPSPERFFRERRSEFEVYSWAVVTKHWLWAADRLVTKLPKSDALFSLALRLHLIANPLQEIFPKQIHYLLYKCMKK